MLSITTGMAAITLQSCGANKDDKSNGADASGLSGRDKIVHPPKQYYDLLLADRMQIASSGGLSQAQEQVLWINFAGATVKQGFDKDQSFLPCADSVRIPSAGLSARDQQSIAQEVAQFYSNAGARLGITLQKPDSGDYTTIHVGGTYADLKCAGGAAAAGIAPFDPGNANPNDVGFVFVKSKDTKALARAIAHESAHTFGLDHSTSKEDLMYPTDSSAQDSFVSSETQNAEPQDGPVLLQNALGSGVATVTGSPVSPTTQTPVVTLPPQNNIKTFPGVPAYLPALPGLGNLANMSGLMSGVPLNVNQALSCVIPAVINGAIPQGTTLPNANGALAALTILQSATMAQNSGIMSMVNLVMLASGMPNVNQIMMAANIALSASSCLSQVTPVSVPGITAQMPGQLSTGINVAQILGMQSVANPSLLIAMIPQYAQVLGTVNQNPNTQAMMSLVLMAVAQQYQGMQFP